MQNNKKYREQISGHQWGEESGEEKYKGRRLRAAKYCV